MRYHYWQFLLNQEGQPINNAQISIFLANSETPASIFLGETTTDVVNVAPQISTLSNGYFEFWISDEENTNLGYERGQKFKLSWERGGISSGIIDNIDIFPQIEGVDENDYTSSYKNKLISNALAHQYSSHVGFDVSSDGFPIHGLMPINLESVDNTINKVISNRNGKQWEDHKNYKFEGYLEDYIPDAPHDLQSADLSSEDPKYNKIVSSLLCKRWEDHRLEYFTLTLSAAPSGEFDDKYAHGLDVVDKESNDIYFNKLVSNKTLNDIVKSTFSTSVSGWTVDGANYSSTISHELGDEFPIVMCWNEATRLAYSPLSIESIDDNNLKLIVDSDTLTLKVKLLRDII